MRAYVTATHKSDEPLLSEQIHKGETKYTMEVLFEYRGCRRQLTASSGENLIECVTTELRRIGRSRAQVYTANVDLRTIDRSGEVYLLQKWSPQWGCYLDVNRASDINDGDKLAVVIKPKPPSKFLLLCCWCCGMQDEPQVQGVPRHKKEAVRKNEEIQALDYVFNVDSVRHSRASEWEETQSLAPSESRETDLKEGEQYVRGESGRASWKLVPMKKCESSEMLPATEANTQLQTNDVPESEGVKGDGIPSESLSQQLETAGSGVASNEIQSVTPPDKSHADEGEQSSAEHKPVVEEATANKEDAIIESKETKEPEPMVSDKGAGIEDIEGDADGIEEKQQGPNPDNEIQETVNDIQIKDDIDAQG